MKENSIAVTGRFQPFHLDHLDLVLQAIESSDSVIVGITNPDLRSLVGDSASPHRHRPDANPFTYFERCQIIEQALLAAGLSASQFTIVPFPLDTPSVWHSYIPISYRQLVRTFETWEHRKVELLEAGGYEVKAITGDRNTRISASDIRAAMATGGDWQRWVPEGAAAVLASFGSDELARRCAAADATT